MNRIRTEYEAHGAIVRTLDERRRIERSKARAKVGGLGYGLVQYALGAVAGVALMSVWAGVYIVRVAA